MLIDPPDSSLSSAVTGAIRRAAQATGTSFDYLLATAHVESGMNPGAGAAMSSARGLFQFIEQTWLAVIKDAGAALGFGRYAAAISKSASGRYQVQDPALRKEILGLRNNPTANAIMAGAFTKANAEALSARLGRAPTDGELYIAHFLGAGGAARLIALAAANPGATAASFFPDAARANRSIFFERTGSPRTAAQVRDILTGRYDLARDESADVTQAAAQATPPTAPDTAALAHAFVAVIPKVSASNRRIFHGLFQDGNPASPVAPLVKALWTAPDATLANNASPPAKNEFGFLDLFRDPVAGS